jgi:hypothetical protein
MPWHRNRCKLCQMVGVKSKEQYVSNLTVISVFNGVLNSAEIASFIT